MVTEIDSKAEIFITHAKTEDIGIYVNGKRGNAYLFPTGWARSCAPIKNAMAYYEQLAPKDSRYLRQMDRHKGKHFGVISLISPCGWGLGGDEVEGAAVVVRPAFLTKPRQEDSASVPPTWIG